MLNIKEKKVMVGDKEVTIKIGQYALQANASVVLTCGETMVQAIVVMGNENPDLDFFPLTVEYNENLYAGGLIKSNKFTKREGKPSDEAILKARLIDRSIRPMFPKDFYREVQVIVNVLATDKTNPHDVLGLLASIISLAISDIPFDCNISGLRLSKIGDNFVINPTYKECEIQDFELVLAGNKDRIIMIECASQCVPDDIIEKGFEHSFKYLGEVAEKVIEIQKEFGKPKIEYTKRETPSEIYDRIKDLTLQRIEEFYIKLSNKEITKKDFDEIVQNPVLKTFTEEELEKYKKKDIIETIDKIFKKCIRENILKNKRRVDGRKLDEIREIEIAINPVPRVHGSSMFMRGETQVLSILTLSPPGNEQILESIEGESTKRYIHHYNAPPYSVGECGRYGSPGRREIGHGALAEKALVPVIPDQQTFPYVIRLVSEVMGQNGSSSMASTCASTISLMASGVPIKEPVAGISIGLITDENDINNFVTLTDIIGFEDFGGDMDFKVAGTRNSITAIQMDTKIKGLSFSIIKQTLKQAREARNKILDIILSVIPEHKKDISEYAPRIETIQIPVDMIGKVVGPGGKVIKQLIADNDVEINIDDFGNVTIAGVNKSAVENVKRQINGIVFDPKEGEIYSGKITRIMDFGAFVEIFPGKEGLIHISKISKERVKSVKDFLKIGQIVNVKLVDIDYQGRLNFSMILDDGKNKK